MDSSADGEAGRGVLPLEILTRTLEEWASEAGADALTPFDGATPQLILGAVDSMLRTTVVISAPIVIIMFLATVGLGLVNRTAPQLNVFFLSMPIKSGLGIALLIVYLPFILDMLMYTKEGEILDPVMKMLKG